MPPAEPAAAPTEGTRGDPSPAATAPRGAGLRIAGYVVVGTLVFAGFLGAIGARLEPPTVAMILCAVALVALLLSMYRMVAALSRPAADVVVGHETVLSSVATRELREEKRRVLRAINELEFDFEMGKLSPKDYRAVRDAYELRAIEAMRALDAEKGLHDNVVRDLAELGLDAASVEAGNA